jgi:acyl-CoA thioester hydrolase
VPFVHTERVRFRDVDAMGHVNNAVYSTYLEQARIAYLKPIGAR